MIPTRCGSCATEEKREEDTRVDRAEFLRHVGDPDETLRESEALRAEALRLWQSIKSGLYRSDGKPLKNPRPDAVVARREVESLYGRAGDLSRHAGRQRLVHDDPWSHTRADLLQAWLAPSRDGS